MSNIKIGIKMRLKHPEKVQWKVTEENSLQSLHSLHQCKFTFDHIFGPECRNSDVYSTIVDPIVKMFMDGYNGLIIAYGQTSSGKTHTMMGTDDNPGIHLLAINQVFKRENISSDLELKIRVGYIEIYRERMYDLLNAREKVTIDPNSQFDVKLSNEEVSVENAKETIEILFRGSRQRKASAKDQNKFSSRSHAIFRITVESENKVNGTIQRSYLNFVHLASSELACDSESNGTGLNNKSLLSLHSVINELSEGEKDINFCDSKLTYILQEALTGNSNIGIICNIRQDVVVETMSTLKFAIKAENVQCAPFLNHSYTDEAFMKIHEDISSLECNFLMNGQMNSSEELHSNIQLSNTEAERKRGLEIKIDPNKQFKKVKRVLEFPSSPSSTVSARTNHSSSLNSSSEISEMFSLENQFQEIANVKIENLRLKKHLAEVKSTHENEKKWLVEEMNAAKLSQRKSEFLQVQDKLLFNKLQNDLDKLRKENENLKIELNKKGGQNLNTNDNLNVTQLLSKLGALNKSNQTSADLLLKQKESLIRLENENVQLKQKNAKLMGRNKFFPPSVTDVDAGIQNKIKRLEDTMARNIQMLKMEFEAKKLQNEPIETSTGIDRVQVHAGAAASHIMTIPDSLAGCVIGKRGSILKSIYYATGAKIAISERNGNADRNVTINGSHVDSVNRAVDLIKKRIQHFEIVGNKVQHGSIESEFSASLGSNECVQK